jgi:hypothetical protein
MPTAAYVARAGQNFILPTHPGDNPVHAPQATTAQITETNRQYTAALVEHTRYLTVVEDLKKQILLAVPPLYLDALKDIAFGFADVSCAQMLAHLQNEYGSIEPDDLEANRARLSADWNPDEPIEALWLRIQEVQRYAADGHEPIANETVLRLLLPVLEKTGVFLHATTTWRDKDPTTCTLATFKDHFARAYKERHRQITSQAAGYHSANAAVTTPPRTPHSPPTPSPTSVPFLQSPGGPKMFYCWTHGLGKNRDHTSPTCNNKAPDHQDAATVNNLMGGSNIIMRGPGPRERSNNRRPGSGPTPPTT